MPVQPTSPFLPKPIYRYQELGIKVARPDIVIPDEKLPSEVMANLIFEDIGGHELLESTRADIINSPVQSRYTIISNQITVNDKFSSINILANQEGMPTASLNINSYIPSSREIIDTRQTPDGFTINVETGNLEINLINLSEGDKVELQVYGFDAKDDTMY